MDRFTFKHHKVTRAFALHWNIVKPSANFYNVAAGLYVSGEFMCGSFVIVRDDHRSILSWTFNPKRWFPLRWVFRREGFSND